MRAHARARTAVALAALLAYGVVANPWPAHAEPRVDVSATRVSPGQDVTVHATGLAPDEPVDLKICGVADEKGALQCAPGLAGVTADPVGAVTQTFAVEEPPGDCPCSVVVHPIGSAPVLTGIELVNHPTAKKVVAPELVVDSAEIVGGSPFGVGGSSELELRLRNAGASPAKATLELSWREGDGEAQPITDPELPEIAPGASRTVTVPLDLDGFVQGTYSVQGSAVVGDLYAPVSTSRSLVPWGMYGVLALVLLLGAGYRMRVATSAGPAGGASGAAEPRPDDEPGPDAPRPDEARPARKRRPVVTRSRPARATRTPGAGAPSLHEPAEPVAPAGTEPAPEPVHARSSEPLVGPPRLAATPIARPVSASPVSASPAAPDPVAPVASAAVTPEPDPTTLLTSYLEATTPRPAPGPTAPVAPVAAPQVPAPQAPAQPGDPGRGSYALPASLDDSGPIPAVAPAPLVLPPQAFAPSVLDEPSVLQRRLAGETPADGTPAVAHRAEALVGVPAANPPTEPQGNEAIVARALASIKENASGPVHLPSPDDLPVPAQRDRRAPKGGKRAKR